jgi:putative ABC transport system permease protein
MSEQPELAVRVISPGYAEAVRMHVLEGRGFTDADAADRPLAVLVSASTARRFWPNGSAVGQRVVLGLISDAPRQVVGVISDVKVHGLVSNDTQSIYVPALQVTGAHMTLAVRTAVAPESMVPSVVGAIHAVDSEQPVVEVHTMDEVIGESVAQQRFAMRLLTAFAGLALLLAAVGIYGVLSYTVRQRVQEIGIRMALGAGARDVVRMVLLEGIKPTGVGVALGLAGAAALGRVLSSLVFGITPRDVTTFAAVSLVVFIVGLVATLLPALRATKVDPLLALRAD